MFTDRLFLLPPSQPSCACGKLKKKPAVFIFIRALDDLYSENRGSVTRLATLVVSHFEKERGGLAEEANLNLGVAYTLFDP